MSVLCLESSSSLTGSSFEHLLLIWSRPFPPWQILVMASWHHEPQWNSSFCKLFSSCILLTTSWSTLYPLTVYFQRMWVVPSPKLSTWKNGENQGLRHSLSLLPGCHHMRWPPTPSTLGWTEAYEARNQDKPTHPSRHFGDNMPPSSMSCELSKKRDCFLAYFWTPITFQMFRLVCVLGKQKWWVPRVNSEVQSSTLL